MSVPEEVLTADKINDLRRRVLTNADYSKDELRKAVHTLMGERIQKAQVLSTASRRRPSRTVNLDDLVGEAPAPASSINLDDLTK